ncbi:PLP-dependent cysteine synthase family protein [Kribbella sancticallisti]|uniref:L-cysteine desulfhydrase Cds1 n=1 Tax=Kribbella sancticallisti TaxID=460087 RepID=A0ABP4N0L2_9ACTN
MTAQRARLSFDMVQAGGHDRTWVACAVAEIMADQNRSADTHLIKLPVAGGVDLYLKDESTHPTGSLKHRLARSLLLYHLCAGAIGPGTTVVEASSGSTAVSEAHFARLIGVPFVAVMTRGTSSSKVRLIEAQGGTCRFVDRAEQVYDEAARLANECGGLYVDQFTYAERATDWRGNNNIAESIFEQLSLERHPEPHWIVVGAGTGGTSATIGRYLRYRGASTRLAVVDPEGSVFFDRYAGIGGASAAGSRIEGIGRPRMEPSFLPAVVDRMMRIPDPASIAAMRMLTEELGLNVGPSTGTNFCGALALASELRAAGETGSIVSLICDSSDRYTATYLDPDWLRGQGWDIRPYESMLAQAWSDGFGATGSPHPTAASCLAGTEDVQEHSTKETTHVGG